MRSHRPSSNRQVTPAHPDWVRNVAQSAAQRQRYVGLYVQQRQLVVLSVAPLRCIQLRLCKELPVLRLRQATKVNLLQISANLRHRVQVEVLHGRNVCRW